MKEININMINPYVRVAMRSILTKGTKINTRALFDYELVYIDKGTLRFKYDGKKYDCTEGQFILIRPGINHSFECQNGDLSQPHIHFDMFYSENSKLLPISFKNFVKFTPQELKIMQPDIFDSFDKKPFVTFSDSNRALELLYGVISYNNQGNVLKTKALMLELVEMLIADNFPKLFSGEKTEKYTVSEQIKDFIDAGQGMAMSLGDFEKHFSYSKYYLERQFKAKYGVGLIAYRDFKRFERACSLLKTHNITDTTARLGFSSVYVFSRAFKNKFGISPSQYKKQKHSD